MLSKESSTSGRYVAPWRSIATASMAVRRHNAVPKVVAVQVRPPYGLHLTFDDGLERDVELADELWGPVFEPLKDPEVFAQVTSTTVRSPGRTGSTAIRSCFTATSSRLPPEATAKRADRPGSLLGDDDGQIEAYATTWRGDPSWAVSKVR